MRGILAPLIKLIVFLVVTAFATYVLGATIANSSYGATKTYRADFSDASGLQVGDDVRIAGVRVGSISDIKIVKHNTAEVSFTVAKDTVGPHLGRSRSCATATWSVSATWTSSTGRVTPPPRSSRTR